VTSAEIPLGERQRAVKILFLEHAPQPRAAFDAEFLGSSLNREFQLRLLLKFERELAHLPLHRLSSGFVLPALKGVPSRKGFLRTPAIGKLLISLGSSCQV